MGRAVCLTCAGSTCLMALLMVLVFQGCSRVEDGENNSGASDTTAQNLPEDSVPADTLSNRFDPASIAPGQRFLGLEVVAADVSLTPDSEYVGTVAFKGPITVLGMFRPHFDADVDARCFFVDNAAAHVLPRFPRDERIPWFCFTNPADVGPFWADSLLDRTVAITVDDYQTVRQFTDAYDTARFVRLEETANEGPML
jgi:hypothetical protein